jgi:hypothetical protein
MGVALFTYKLLPKGEPGWQVRRDCARHAVINLSRDNIIGAILTVKELHVRSMTARF